MQQIVKSPLLPFLDVKAAATFGAVASLESMRPLKIIMTALLGTVALVAGLFIAVVAAITSVALFFLKRSRGTPAPRRPVPLSHARGASAPKAADRDVIDVTATEVPADSAGR